MIKKNFLVFVLLAFLFTSYSSAQCYLGRNLQKKLDQNEKEIPVIVVFKKSVRVKNALQLSTFSTEPDQARKQIKRYLEQQNAHEQGFITSLCDRMKQAKKIQKAEGFWLINAMTVKADSSAIEELSAQGEIAQIILDVPRLMINPRKSELSTLAEIPEDWGVDFIRSQEANRNGFTGQGVKVAVVDTGVAPHTELEGRLLSDKGKSFVDGEEDSVDLNGHGTHCAGTVAGNRFGVAPGAQIIPIKVLGASGFGTFTGIMEGVQHAVAEGAQVISMSLGGRASVEISPLETVIEEAIDAGVVCVIAAGNEGPGSQTIASPGALVRAITVGANDIEGEIAGFSSRGPTIRGDEKPDLSAPGVDITSASTDGQSFAKLSGTSMATPHVAGLVALLLEKKSQLTHDQIKKILMETSRGKEEVNVFGAGIVDAVDALTALDDPSGEEESLPAHLFNQKKIKRDLRQGIQKLMKKQKKFFRVEIKDVSLNPLQVVSVLRVQITHKKTKKSETLRLEMVLQSKKWVLTKESKQEVQKFIGQ